MRENKFRGWDGKRFYYFTLKDLWAEGCETQLSELIDSKRLSLNTDFPYKDIEQYTGLKNKDGVEIYEGDILSFGDNFGYAVKIGETELCILGYEYNDYINYYGVYLEGFFHEKDIVDDITRAKIIGNIHETPELLND